MCHSRVIIICIIANVSRTGSLSAGRDVIYLWLVLWLVRVMVILGKELNLLILGIGIPLIQTRITQIAYRIHVYRGVCTGLNVAGGKRIEPASGGGGAASTSPTRPTRSTPSLVVSRSGAARFSSGTRRVCTARRRTIRAGFAWRSSCEGSARGKCRRSARQVRVCTSPYSVS